MNEYPIIPLKSATKGSSLKIVSGIKLPGLHPTYNVQVMNWNSAT